MRNVTFIFGLTALLLLSGCGGKTWTHATKNESQFYADSLSCQQMAMQMHPQRKAERMPVRDLPPSSYQTNCTDYGTNINCNTRAIGGGPDPYAQGYNYGAQAGESLGNALNSIAMQNTYERCLMSRGYRAQ